MTDLPSPSAGSPGRHPLFDDGRALDWYTRLDDATSAAAASGRRIFVLVGGRRCQGTRMLVEKCLAKAEIADEVRRDFVALAADAAALEPAVEALLGSLPKREPTPVCIYLTVEGRVAYSTIGGRSPAVLLSELLEGHTR
jgi:hypothetical protein